MKALIKFVLITCTLTLPALGCSQTDDKTMLKKNTQPITVFLGMTTDDFLKVSNKEFLRVNKQPAGMNFYTQKWGYNTDGTLADGTVFLKNIAGSFQLDHVSSVMIYEDVTHKNKIVDEIDIGFGFDSNVKITHAKAHQAMMALLDKLKKAGWKYDLENSRPRLKGRDTYLFASNPKMLSSTFPIDPEYALTLAEWTKEAVKMGGYYWQLRTDDGAHMSINYYIGREDNYAPDEATYLASMTITSDKKEVLANFKSPEWPNWKNLYPDLYQNKFPEWRLEEESKAISMGLKINTEYKDYRNHYVFKELGIDTSTFKSIDPYKITYKQYMEQKDKPKQSEKAPVKRISCQGGTSCPETGYWFTPAKENSRQYFNEGDIFPKYDLNNWGVIHWQWDGEDA